MADGGRGMGAAAARGVAVRWLAIAIGVSGCALPAPMHRAPARLTGQHLDCATARSSSIETLRTLGYAVVGSYEPMPGRLTILAAEKTSPGGRFQSNVTIRCDGEEAEVTAAQPALARHDPHFEDDFRAAWEERSEGRLRPPLTRSGAIEVTRGAAATAATRPPAVGSAPTPRVAATAGEDVRAPRVAATPTPGRARESAAPEAPPPPRDEPTAAPASAPLVRFDLLSSADARDRFGADLAAAELVAARLTIVNRTERPYVVSLPLLAMIRAGGEVVRPLTWTDASARLARSPSGQGWKAYDDLERELVGDGVLAAGESLHGILLYPAGDYASIDVVLIDQKSARSERFEAAIPPAASN